MAESSISVTLSETIIFVMQLGAYNNHLQKAVGIIGRQKNDLQRLLPLYQRMKAHQVRVDHIWTTFAESMLKTSRWKRHLLILVIPNSRKSLKYVIDFWLKIALLVGGLSLLYKLREYVTSQFAIGLKNDMYQD